MSPSLGKKISLLILGEQKYRIKCPTAVCLTMQPSYTKNTLFLSEIFTPKVCIQHGVFSSVDRDQQYIVDRSRFQHQTVAFSIGDLKSITVTVTGRRQFVPRDQFRSLNVIQCLLLATNNQRLRSTSTGDNDRKSKRFCSNAVLCVSFM